MKINENQWKSMKINEITAELPHYYIDESMHPASVHLNIEFGSSAAEAAACKSGRGLEWNEPCKAVGRSPSSNLISQSVATKLI